MSETIHDVAARAKGLRRPLAVRETIHDVAARAKAALQAAREAATRRAHLEGLAMPEAKAKATEQAAAAKATEQAAAAKATEQAAAAKADRDKRRAESDARFRDAMEKYRADSRKAAIESARRERERRAAEHAQQLQVEAEFRRQMMDDKKKAKAALKKQTEEEAAAMLERIRSDTRIKRVPQDSAMRRTIEHDKNRVSRTGEVCRDGHYRGG